MPTIVGLGQNLLKYVGFKTYWLMIQSVHFHVQHDSVYWTKLQLESYLEMDTLGLFNKNCQWQDLINKETIFDWL